MSNRPLGEETVPGEPILRHRKWMCRLKGNHVSIGVENSHGEMGGDQSPDRLFIENCDRLPVLIDGDIYRLRLHDPDDLIRIMITVGLDNHPHGNGG